jgi:hypothetical protein
MGVAGGDVGVESHCLVLVAGDQRGLAVGLQPVVP